MTKYFCDRCGFEMPSDSIDRSVANNINDTGPKFLCKSCWEQWKETFFRFFQKQGQ